MFVFMFIDYLFSVGVRINCPFVCRGWMSERCVMALNGFKCFQSSYCANINYKVDGMHLIILHLVGHLSGNAIKEM